VPKKKQKFRVGQTVSWKWPPGYVTGVVLDCFNSTVRREIKGSTITRHGSPSNPAYLLLTRKGVEVLKLESELRDESEFPGKSS
jgi:hypothetical protein